MQQLTLSSFSTENWNRPAEEVTLLMDLYVEYMRSQRQLLIDTFWSEDEAPQFISPGWARELAEEDSSHLKLSPQVSNP